LRIRFFFCKPSKANEGQKQDKARRQEGSRRRTGMRSADCLPYMTKGEEGVKRKRQRGRETNGIDASCFADIFAVLAPAHENLAMGGR
jgi:hypothetical protein